MFKLIISIIFTISLGATSIFFFYKFNFFIAIILLACFISRLVGYNHKRQAKGFGEITTHLILETQCNCALEFQISIEEILKHPAIERLFNQLQMKNVISTSTQKEDWIKKMLDNYRKKFSREKLEEVRFNIKNNLVWKNGIIDFNDSIYHEIFIPYEYKDGKEEKSTFRTPSIEIGITIRLFIVNGIIKLQVGDFSREYTPNKLSNTSYQTHDTITSFPLMYFSYLHKIPVKYLNLLAYATESWKNAHGEKRDKRSKGLTADWKELLKEIKDYNYVCSVADVYVGSYKKWDTIIARFQKKKSEMLKRDNFENLFPRSDDHDFYEDLMPNDRYYSNEYLSVNIVNHNKKGQYIYTDYYEDSP
jgi:hypothetical protein